MEEITAEFIKAFIRTNDIPLVATQTRLCIPIIFRMCRKMSSGIRFDDIKVCDKLIIEGHHRYLSALISNFELGSVPTNSTSSTKPTGWDLVEFDEDDWDTPAKIAHLNQLDAEYNGLDIDFVTRLTLR